MLHAEKNCHSRSRHRSWPMIRFSQRLHAARAVCSHCRLFTAAVDKSTSNVQSGNAVRVRFAPSPTGSLHLGGLRTALFNYLFARGANGSHILRIEDTDKKREVAGSDLDLFKALRSCGVHFDEGPDFLYDAVSGEHEGNDNGDTEDSNDDEDMEDSRVKYGPYVQSARQKLGVYKEHADALLECGAAYRCFCSAERLAAVRAARARAGEAVAGYDRACASIDPAEAARRAAEGEPYVVRLDSERVGRATTAMPMSSTASTAPLHADTRVGVDANTVLQFVDLVHGPVTFDAASAGTIDDQVLLKADGFPTYHLASVVDDHLMHVTHVIRGEEWLPSTPKHLALYHAFGWKPPVFAHLPLLLAGADWYGSNDESARTGAESEQLEKRTRPRGKLSKRHGAASVESVLQRGILPAALVNYVALLGWSPSAGSEGESADAGHEREDEVLTVDELVQRFSLAAVNSSGAAVDRKRLEWLNGQHLRRVLSSALDGDLDTCADDHAARAAAAEKLYVLRKATFSIIAELEGRALSNGGTEQEEKIEQFLTAHGKQRVWRALQLVREKVRTLDGFGTFCAPYFAAPPLRTADERSKPASHATGVRVIASVRARKVAAACRKKHWVEVKDASKPSEASLSLVREAVLRLAALSAPEYTSAVEASEASHAVYHAEGVGWQPEVGWESNAIVGALKVVSKERSVGMKRVMMPLRYVLTGMDVGAPIGEVIELLGRAETMHRLERFIIEEESEP